MRDMNVRQTQMNVFFTKTDQHFKRQDSKIIRREREVTLHLPPKTTNTSDSTLLVDIVKVSKLTKIWRKLKLVRANWTAKIKTHKKWNMRKNVHILEATWHLWIIERKKKPFCSVPFVSELTPTPVVGVVNRGLEVNPSLYLLDAVVCYQEPGLII